MFKSSKASNELAALMDQEITGTSDINEKSKQASILLSKAANLFSVAGMNKESDLIKAILKVKV